MDEGHLLENTLGQWQFIALYTVALFVLVKLNCWYRSDVREMTPEERQQHDEDNANPDNLL